MTSSGHPITFHYSNTCSPRKMSFPKNNRFIQYRDWEKSTGILVGPGSYDSHISAYKYLKKPCMTKICKPQGIQRENTDGYIMEGSHIVYYPRYIGKIDKNDKERLNLSKVGVDVKSGIPYLKKRKSVDKLNFSITPNEFLKTMRKYYANILKNRSTKLYGCSGGISSLCNSGMKSVSTKRVNII